MINQLALMLVETAVAASIAILMVALLRRPFRHALGARAAYWLWMLVPASVLVILLPTPSLPASIAASGIPAPIGHAVSSAVVFISAAKTFDHVLVALLLWLAGALLMFARAAERQRTFIRSLGSLRAEADGIYRSACRVEPMLIGSWRPRIVLPADLEARYTAEEIPLILAHERAHLQRGDALVNAFATGWLCLFWFNPLMYWAVGWLRFDQELACDALVLTTANVSRRRYANALLKSQLNSDSAWALPLGCQWHSSHPLKERIGMLLRPLASGYRRAFGVAIALIITVSGSYAVWASQPGQPLLDSHSSIAIRMALPAPNASASGRPGRWGLCLVTTQCRALEKLPPRMCPAGARACELTGRVVPLASYRLRPLGP